MEEETEEAQTPLKLKKPRLNTAGTAGTAVSTISGITSESTPATEAESPAEEQIDEEPQLSKLMLKVKECLERFYEVMN